MANEMHPPGNRPPTPPPLPPPPPPPQNSHNPKPRAEKPSAYLASLEAAGPDFMETAVDVPMPDKPSGPIWYFFYGTLTKPEILKHVLDIEEEPSLRPATIVGYSLSSWGQYPALIDGDTGEKVSGYGYEVQSIEHEYKLARYETNAYKLHPCKIQFDDGKEPLEVYGNTFMYAGDSEALKAGRFDRVLWEIQMGMRLPDAWRTPWTGLHGDDEASRDSAD
ncbi:hypothetical protein F5B20DRAFT_363530 [Whalleya microplaca]|nr:hypothetical protein F5B20DRAFT_363530 [Whalleya microplaca]